MIQGLFTLKFSSTLQVMGRWRLTLVFSYSSAEWSPEWRMKSHLVTFYSSQGDIESYVECVSMSPFYGCCVIHVQWFILWWPSKGRCRGGHIVSWHLFTLHTSNQGFFWLIIILHLCPWATLTPSVLLYCRVSPLCILNHKLKKIVRVFNKELDWQFCWKECGLHYSTVVLHYEIFKEGKSFQNACQCILVWTLIIIKCDVF